MTNEELVLLIQHTDCKKEHLETLYNQNRGIIAEIASRYTQFFELDDLMQEGSIGLIEAADSYNPEMGVKFVSYAAGCIRYHLLNYLRDHGYIVSFPAHLIEKVRKMNRLIDDYYKQYAHEPSIWELSDLLKITPQQARQLLSDSKKLQIKSINEVISAEDDSLELGDTIADPENQYEDIDDRIQHEQLKEVLWDIVDSLGADQAKVMHMRYEGNKTGKEIAASMGVTLGNVRSIEDRAMRELRKNRNTRKLRPFFPEDKIYSLSLQYCGSRRFINTWTSAPEQAILLAERNGLL